MANKIIHMLGHVNGYPMILDFDATTRCGRTACVIAGSPSAYEMLDLDGAKFEATTRTKNVTCRKCNSLIKEGTLHARTKAI